MTRKVHEEVIVVKLSKLIKTGREVPKIATPEFIDSLLSVAEELAGPGVVVEVEE